MIRNYRNLSITQSKRYIIIFHAPGTITVQYWGVGVPVSPAPVTVATYTPADRYPVRGAGGISESRSG